MDKAQPIVVYSGFVGFLPFASFSLVIYCLDSQVLCAGCLQSIEIHSYSNINKSLTFKQTCKQENIHQTSVAQQQIIKNNVAAVWLSSHAKTLPSVWQSNFPYLNGSSDVVEVQTGWPKRNLWLVPQFRSCFISVPALVKNSHKFPRKLIPRPPLVYFFPMARLVFHP